MKTKDTEGERLERERLQDERPQAPALQGQAPSVQPRQAERLSTADVARAASAERQESREGVPALERGSDAPAPLFAPDIMNEFRSRWMDVQTGFVDTPREAVERADELVAEAIKRLAESFARERSRLEAQWARDGDVSTEDLRVALQRYRTFFERLLHV